MRKKKRKERKSKRQQETEENMIGSTEVYFQCIHKVIVVYSTRTQWKSFVLFTAQTY